MAGLDFTTPNSSNVNVTGQPALTANKFAIAACILPDSIGQNSLGHIFQAATAGSAVRTAFTLALSGADLVLRMTVIRSLVATTFIANNRKILPSTSTSTPAVVAMYFDDASSPRAGLFSTGDGTVNDADLAACTYGTSTAGTGTVTGGDSLYTIGNAATFNAQFDGVIAWVHIWSGRVPSLAEMQAVATGINPRMVGDGANTGDRLAFLDDASGVQDQAAPSVLWTPTACTVKDIPGVPGGGWFASGGGVKTQRAA